MHPERSKRGNAAMLIVVLLMLVIAGGCYLSYTKLSEYERGLEALAEQFRVERETQRENILEAREAIRAMHRQADDAERLPAHDVHEITARSHMQPLVERHYALQQSMDALGTAAASGHQQPGAEAAPPADGASADSP